MVARAVAKESGANFLNLDVSTLFDKYCCPQHTTHTHTHTHYTHDKLTTAFPPSSDTLASLTSAWMQSSHLHVAVHQPSSLWMRLMACWAAGSGPAMTGSCSCRTSSYHCKLISSSSSASQAVCVSYIHVRCTSGGTACKTRGWALTQSWSWAQPTGVALWIELHYAGCHAKSTLGCQTFVDALTFCTASSRMRTWRVTLTCKLWLVPHLACVAVTCRSAVCSRAL